MLIALLEFRVTITAVARVSMAAGGIITQTRTCRIYMRLIHTSYLILCDGSYYYKNTNGSTYYNDGNGNSKYTPSSQTSKK